MQIEYKRGRRADGDMAKRMVYTSRCGNYKVERMESRFQDRVVWYALQLQTGGYFDIMRRERPFRTRKAAEKHIQKYVNKCTSSKKS